MGCEISVDLGQALFLQRSLHQRLDLLLLLFCKISVSLSCLSVGCLFQYKLCICKHHPHQSAVTLVSCLDCAFCLGSHRVIWHTE